MYAEVSLANALKCLKCYYQTAAAHPYMIRMIFPPLPVSATCFSRLLLPSSHGIHLPPFLVTAFCITNRMSNKKRKEKRQHKHNKMYSSKKKMSFPFKDKWILLKLSKMKIV